MSVLIQYLFKFLHTTVSYVTLMAPSKLMKNTLQYDEPRKWICVFVGSKGAGNLSLFPPSCVSCLHSHLLSVHLLFDMLLQKTVTG